MNFIAQTFARDILAEARSYTYDAQSFAPLYDLVSKKITAYDPSFGPYLANHLKNVSHDTEHFMRHLGYTEDVAQKIGHAFALHDIGKIKQDIDLWQVTADKRTLSPEQKRERARHTDLGPELLEEVLTELGHELTEDQKKHLDLARYLMLNHHERLDGSGPKGFIAPMMDQILCIVAIVDTVDGKIKAKGLSQIFEDMSGSKHAGQFDEGLVAAYEAYYRENRTPEPASTPVLANTAHSL